MQSGDIPPRRTGFKGKAEVRATKRRSRFAIGLAWPDHRESQALAYQKLLQKHHCQKHYVKLRRAPNKCFCFVVRSTHEADRWMFFSDSLAFASTSHLEALFL